MEMSSYVLFLLLFKWATALSDLIGTLFSFSFFFLCHTLTPLSLFAFFLFSTLPDHKCSAVYYHTMLLSLTPFLTPIPSQEKKKREKKMHPVVLMKFANTLHDVSLLAGSKEMTKEEG